MHTTSVEEDGVCYGENRTGLRLPLDAALQPSCGKRRPSPPAHKPKRTAEWRIAEQPLVAMAIGSGRSVTAAGKGHKFNVKRSIFDCTMPTQNPSDDLAAKKRKLAQENSFCTHNSEKQKSKKLKRVTQVSQNILRNRVGGSSSTIFPNSRTAKHCENFRAS